MIKSTDGARNRKFRMDAVLFARFYWSSEKIRRLPLHVKAKTSFAENEVPLNKGSRRRVQSTSFVELTPADVYRYVERSCGKYSRKNIVSNGAIVIKKVSSEIFLWREHLCRFSSEESIQETFYLLVLELQPTVIYKSFFPFSMKNR